MSSRFSDRRCLLLLAAWFLSPASLSATTITGNGEIIKSTSTPPPPTIRPQPLPESEEDPVEPRPSASREKSSPREPAKSSVSKEAFAAAMRAGESKFRERDFPGALKKMDEAEALSPGDPNVLNLRGGIYAESGDYEKAAALYREAVEKQPDLFWPAYNLAEVSFVQKKFPEAREAFTATLAKFPGNEILKFKIFLTYLEEKNDAEAKALLDKLPFPSSTPAYYYSWAAWEFRHGNSADGAEWIKSAARIFGESKTAFFHQSLSELKMVPPAETPTLPPS